MLRTWWCSDDGELPVLPFVNDFGHLSTRLLVQGIREFSAGGNDVLLCHWSEPSWSDSSVGFVFHVSSIFAGLHVADARFEDLAPATAPRIAATAPTRLWHCIRPLEPPPPPRTNRPATGDASTTTSAGLDNFRDTLTLVPTCPTLLVRRLVPVVDLAFLERKAVVSSIPVCTDSDLPDP